jgi:hypothetical protein
MTCFSRAIDFEHKYRKLINLFKLNRKVFRTKFKNRHRNRGYAIEEMNYLSDLDFKKMFRMDRLSFLELEKQLDPYLIRNDVMSIRSSGSPISTRTRLAVTIRWLAGGSHLDICFAFGVSASSFYSDRGILWPTIEALNSILDISFPLNDDSALAELAKGFREHSGGVFDGLVTVIDGMAVRVRCPTEKEVPVDRMKYVCRKGGFAVILLAGCDVKGRFTMAVANHAGSTHDIICWESSNIYNALLGEKLDKRYYLGGDEAFTCTAQLISPWSGRGIGRWKDSFNYWLSHSRQAIERAFGMLTKRWGIFSRRFCFAYERWSLVIIVCCKLHNFCLNKNLNAMSETLPCYDRDIRNGDEWVVLPNNDPVEDPILRGHPSGDLRKNITDNLEHEGRGRPLHAIANSRAD